LVNGRSCRLYGGSTERNIQSAESLLPEGVSCLHSDCVGFELTFIGGGSGRENRGARLSRESKANHLLDFKVKLSIGDYFLSGRH
jgi:hypothetical protein